MSGIKNDYFKLLDSDPAYQQHCDERFIMVAEHERVRAQTVSEWLAEFTYFYWEYHTGENNMTDRSEMFKSKSNYLKAEDLPEGKEFELIISGTETADMNGEQKLIVMFQGRQKGLMLNNTNYKKISAAYGHDDAKWAGNKVLLYRDMTDYQGKDVPCLRVRVENERVVIKAPPAPQMPPASFDDEIPF
jgi:hypothetical protein